MAALEEPGLLRFIAESSIGSQQILHAGIRTELLSTTSIPSRVRLDVPDSMVAQRLSPTPSTGRAVQPLIKKEITANGYLIVQHKSDAADTHDPDDALAKCNISVIVRDHSVPLGQPGDYVSKTLTIADRDTSRLADDQVFSTGAYRDIYAFKVPTGQSWMMHGEHEIWVADDTA